jgi:hypothetical protein
MPTLERIQHRGIELALILWAQFHGTREGVSNVIEFLTPDHYSQQLAYICRPPGYCVPAHKHNPVQRVVTYTREVIYVKSGVVVVNLYDDSDAYVTSRTLRAGDWILLASGGHGFEMVTACELIEVKQGPYTGPQDKTLIVLEKPF